MTTKCIKNLCVKTSTWKDKEGNEKAKWLNIGSILQKEDGGKFMLLDRHVNLAGLPFKEGSSTILISMFDPKEDDDVKKNNKNIDKTKFQDDEIPF